MVVVHLAALFFLFVSGTLNRAWRSPMAVGNTLLVAAIIEGALLIGWRLTQIPKSQSLEFLLVSQVSPRTIFLAEASVGVVFFLLTSLAGLPILLIMVQEGILLAGDLSAVFWLPIAWGLTTGAALTAWAYESQRVRAIGEKVIGVGIVVYLVLGVLAGENLGDWIESLPRVWSRGLMATLRGLHDYNPFGAMKFAMEHSPAWSADRVKWVSGIGLALTTASMFRAAFRFHGHFQDEHYQPARTKKNERRPEVGDEPLRWWAIKRVTRYAGRINIWLAGGFGLAYSAYILAGPHWPTGLGRQAFETFERMGGVPVVAAALVILAAVPAAFQYGLWDASESDRCRRLELLLLTNLSGDAYWNAALAAAWRRGKGYLFVACLLWLAWGFSGRSPLTHVLAAGAMGVVAWSLYFTLGFRAFSTGMAANHLGLTLTLLVPLATFILWRSGGRMIAEWLPPGALVSGLIDGPSVAWSVGPIAAGVLALWLARTGIRNCDANLRRWYDGRHGSLTAE